MNNRLFNKLTPLILLITFIVFFRLVPHVPNATPLGYSILGTARKRGFFSATVVLAASLLLSDILIGIYNPFLMLAVYGSFMVYIILGYLAAKKILSLPTPFLLLLSSLIFFFVTNVGVWAFSPWYPKTPLGLWLCLLAGVPFFGFMAAGDMISLAIHQGFINVFKVLKSYKLFVAFQNLIHTN